MSAREQILSRPDCKIERVEVPEWDPVEVYVRSPSVRLMAEIRKSEELTGVGQIALMVAHCACNEGGERIFQDDDIDALGERDFDVINRIATAALRLSGLDKEAVDDAAGKSDETP